ncbi:hypothetical protein [Olleya sp. R77988]|uniref:hypothetical protein n=1 Tax=Olleya sp. R77988 TaxID=3093875 RepID=UPI0037C9E249
MKYLNKILYLFVVSAIVTSCNRDLIETDLGAPNTLFYPSDSGTLLVENGASNLFDVVVSATAIANTNTPYTITVDDASTAVEGVDFNITTASTTLNNGEIVTSFSVVADFDNAATEGKTVIFNLSSNSSSVSDSNQFTLNLIKLCPISAPFTGDYALSYVANGIFDTPTFTPGVYTLSVGAEPTDRVFSAPVYPAFGVFGPADFNFSLICDNVVVVSGQPTGVGCGGVSTTLGPAATAGTYDGADDSVIQVIYIDDEGGNSCGDPITAEFTLTKL